MHTRNGVEVGNVGCTFTYIFSRFCTLISMTDISFSPFYSVFFFKFKIRYDMKELEY